MPIDYDQLRQIINDDPALAADFAKGSDNTIAAALNKPSGESVSIGAVLPHMIVGAIDGDEFAKMSAGLQNLFMAMVISGSIDTSNANVVANLGKMFGSGTNTAANLQALLTREGTKAEVLFEQPGLTLTDDDIAKVRAVIEIEQKAADAQLDTGGAIKVSP